MIYITIGIYPITFCPHIVLSIEKRLKESFASYIYADGTSLTISIGKSLFEFKKISSELSKNDCIKEINIKNSRFICILSYVDNEDEIKSILENIKLKYKDSTHVTYAWKLENKQKYSDDGEPGGTAGAPIMEVILKNDIINVLAIVVRYFGGIKLGAGGLIRAYSKSVREALLESGVSEYIKYNYYEIEASYDDLKLLNTLVKDFDVIDKNFGENIVYRVKIRECDDNVNSIFYGTNIVIKKISWNRLFSWDFYLFLTDVFSLERFNIFDNTFSATDDDYL